MSSEPILFSAKLLANSHAGATWRVWNVRQPAPCAPRKCQVIESRRRCRFLGWYPAGRCRLSNVFHRSFPFVQTELARSTAWFLGYRSKLAENPFLAQITAPTARQAVQSKHSARCLVGAQLPATSCLGAFWTPASFTARLQPLRGCSLCFVDALAQFLELAIFCCEWVWIRPLTRRPIVSAAITRVSNHENRHDYDQKLYAQRRSA